MDTIKQCKSGLLNTEQSHRSSGGIVAVYSTDESHNHTHEKVARTKIAEQLAVLTGRKFVGEYDHSYCGVYFVPNETLVGIERANELGMRCEHDLFGGLVPYPFIATKAITHPLIEPDAQAPKGWSHEFSRRVHGSVLLGYSVFTLDDARRAGRCLLQHGPVRIKPVRATGGRGQTVISNFPDLEIALNMIDSAELLSCGLVLEENLKAVTTYSVGQVRVSDLLATYYGTQRLTRDRKGEYVYGGSDLLIVRGDFEALVGLHPSREAQLALTQAQVYDTAAMELFTGMFASRRNYDIAQGLNSEGRWCSGVLEQSWRIGGASSAEIVALAAF